MYIGPNKLKKYQVNDCAKLLTTLFTTDDISNLSIRQCGIAIKNNTQQLTNLLAKLLTVENINTIKQKLRWLNKFTNIDIPTILIESIKSSPMKNDIIRFSAKNLQDQDHLFIIDYFRESIDFNSMLDHQQLLQNGKILMEIRNNTKFEQLFQQLKAHLKSKIVIESKINEEYVIEIMQSVQVEQEIGCAILSEIVGRNLHNYGMLQHFVDEAIRLQQLQFVSCIQNYIEQSLKNEQLIFQLAQEVVEKGAHQFVQKFMLAKLNTTPQYQQLQLQMVTSKFVTENKKYDNIFSNIEQIATIRYVDEIIMVSNYYWNQGQVILNLPNPLQDCNLEISKAVQQRFSSLQKQNHQIYQLYSVILHVKYQNMLLFITPLEYLILEQFQKINQCKLNKTNCENAKRLIEEGILEQKGSDYQIIEANIHRLTNFEYAKKPIQQKQVVEQEVYEQNKKLMQIINYYMSIEAGTMKLMKLEKKIEFPNLFSKVSQLIKRSMILSEIELKEVLKGLVKRDLLCLENDVIFYNI